MLRACAGSAAVLVVPGALIACALRLSLRALVTWAVVPAFSLAAVFVTAEIANLVGLPFNLVTVAVAVAALALLVYLRRGRTRLAGPALTTDDALPPDPEAPPETRRTFEKRLALAMLLLSVVGGLLIWQRGIHGYATVPPEVDASNHGFFVARVLATDSIDVAKVVVSDAAGKHRLASFYPLALHASAATSARLAGADIGRVLLVYDIVFASVVLPLGMFVLARALVPRSYLTAGFTAIAVPALVIFPWGSIGFGDVPLVVGMALVPVTVLFIASALLRADDPLVSPVGPIVAAGLVALTAIAVHTSQVPLLVVLVGVLLLDRARVERSAAVLKRGVIRAVGVGAVVVVLFAPTLRLLAGGVSERSSVSLTAHRKLASALGHLLALQPPQVPTRQLLFAVLAFAGVVIWLVGRRPA